MELVGQLVVRKCYLLDKSHSRTGSQSMESVSLFPIVVDVAVCSVPSFQSDERNLSVFRPCEVLKDNVVFVQCVVFAESLKALSCGWFSLYVNLALTSQAVMVVLNTSHFCGTRYVLACDLRLSCPGGIHVLFIVTFCIYNVCVLCITHDVFYSSQH